MLVRFFMVLIALIGIVWFGLALPDRTAELAALEDELQFEAELRSSSLLKQVDGFETSAQLLGQTEVIGPVIEEDGQAFFELDILQDTIGAESIYVVERGRAGSIPSGRMSLAKFNLPDWQETLEAAFLGRIGSTSYVNAAGAPLFVYF
ncbi:MAG: hypothetical protein AAGA63_06365, partial [Pseudomonadota bacterium]